jgi:hypothetical protein
VSHTPGPWWTDDRRPFGGALQIQAQHRGERSSYCVASINGYEDPEANAKLIAAAPDLLELLQELVDIEGPQPGHVMWANKVKAAIEKATL